MYISFYITKILSYLAFNLFTLFLISYTVPKETKKNELSVAATKIEGTSIVSIGRKEKNDSIISFSFNFFPLVLYCSFISCFIVIRIEENGKKRYVKKCKRKKNKIYVAYNT